MCGICGYISKSRLDDSILEQMRDTMIHRGPDDAGIWQRETGEGSFIGFAHRRLSIFDLSELGHQPMTSKDGAYTIAYNGEVYNFKEIRTKLEEKGYVFASNCDTEVVLNSYIQWGEECFSKLNGMFAIAIWDNNKGELILARDRMGVKPLYYYHNKSNADFVFASELKPIMKYPGFKKTVRMDMLGNYLCNKYIASPDTIFEDTFKMEPGTYAVLKDNTLVVNKYWDLIERKHKAVKNLITDYDEAKREIDRVLTDGVCRRMVADVPVGMFLSSGIDSALVTAIAQRNSSTPIKTFTIGFNDKERNEADKAKKIAEYLGTDHTEYYIGEKEIFSLLNDITDYYDEPFSDSSQFPTMLVSKLAAENVTVALSGDGGDELFCGYKIYDLVYIAQKSDPIGNILNVIPGLGDSAIVPKELRAFINNRDDGYKTQLFNDVFKEEAEKILPGVSFNPKYSQEEMIKCRNWQERRMLLDMMTYLPDEIMQKTDRASMKYSLEVRSPLLDVKVVEKSLQIPHSFKYHSFDKKHILKDLTYDYIPKELLSGPKKGFGVPLRKWLRGPLKEEINKYSEKTFLDKQGIFDYRGVDKLIKNQEKSDNILYSSVLWSYYMFQRWLEKYNV